ncbi:hypothetical protein KZ287_32855, partial [Escherichia coli]|nr:hypothetical protein [Escherichia coli]
MTASPYLACRRWSTLRRAMPKPAPWIDLGSGGPGGSRGARSSSVGLPPEAEGTDLSVTLSMA